MDFAEQLTQHVVIIRDKTGRRLFEGAGEHGRNFLDGDAAGVFAGQRAAHAVADRKGKVRFGG
jgi:hypothetical protein